VCFFDYWLRPIYILKSIGQIVGLLANPGKLELKIEDCKLNIRGCRLRGAGFCAACRSVIASPVISLDIYNH